jgi:HAD superfamily hydrolase (TIGR01484 family)
MLEELIRKKGIKANRERIKHLLDETKVIYTDIDGTFLGPSGCFFLDSKKNYTLRPAQALLKALEKNIDIVMISGRHMRQLRENARIFGFKNYVAEMGTIVVYNQGEKVIYNLGDFKKTDEPLFETIKKSGVLDLLYKTYKGKLEDHSPWSAERDCTPLFRGYVDTAEANKLLKQNGYDNLVLVDNGAIFRKSETLDVPETHAYHLVPKGVSKDSGIKIDRRIRDIPKKATIALGDAVADLTFAKEVGVFFMVKNGLVKNSHLAEQILKADNVFVTENEMGLGWAEAIEEVTSLF